MVPTLKTGRPSARAIRGPRVRPLPANAKLRLVGVRERAAAAFDTLEVALADAARALSCHGHVTSEIVSGPPADALVRATAQVASDLVVVGARGAGALTRLLLGSVSEAVLRHAACPVLIVRRCR